MSRLIADLQTAVCDMCGLEHVCVVAVGDMVWGLAHQLYGGGVEVKVNSGVLEASGEWE